LSFCVGCREFSFMLILRRRAAMRLGLGLLGSIWAFLSCTSRPRPGTPGGGLHPVTTDAGTPAVASLEQDLARLDQRAYSEQGVPVFLVCEDLAREDLTRAASLRGKGFARGRESAALAEDFRRQTRLLEQIRPARTKADVAKLIEILADRDFGRRVRPPSP
jgi:hypothetical protein